jgi:hypothetical protein
VCCVVVGGVVATFFGDSGLVIVDVVVEFFEGLFDVVVGGWRAPCGRDMQGRDMFDVGIVESIVFLVGGGRVGVLVSEMESGRLLERRISQSSS